MKTNTQLTDPYSDIVPNSGDPNWLRVSLDVSRSDAFFLYGILMERGTLSIVLANFLKHITDHAKRNNWTVGDRDKLIAYVNERCTTGELGGNACGTNVGCTTTGVRSPEQRTSNKPKAQRRKQTDAAVVVEDENRADGNSTD